MTPRLISIAIQNPVSRKEHDVFQADFLSLHKKRNNFEQVTFYIHFLPAWTTDICGGCREHRQVH
jgi:hypothetical protein